MTMQARDTQAGSAAPFEARGRKYLRAPVPVYFPVEAKVPESEAHQTRREILAGSVRKAFSGEAMIASDQFLYWDPTNPRKCLAPDLALRRGPHGGPIHTWKVWERGAPELAVELVSDSDRPPPHWKRGLQRYRATGVMELVRFDAANFEHPLRVWDRVEGDLVERQLDDPSRAECVLLKLWWVMKPHPLQGSTLRLSRDPDGTDLLLTEQECREQAERERDQQAAARETAEARAQAAEQRLAELEAGARRGQ